MEHPPIQRRYYSIVLGAALLLYAGYATLRAGARGVSSLSVHAFVDTLRPEVDSVQVFALACPRILERCRLPTVRVVERWSWQLIPTSVRVGDDIQFTLSRHVILLQQRVVIDSLTRDSLRVRWTVDTIVPSFIEDSVSVILAGSIDWSPARTQTVPKNSANPQEWKWTAGALTEGNKIIQLVLPSVDHAAAQNALRLFTATDSGPPAHSRFVNIPLAVNPRGLGANLMTLGTVAAWALGAGLNAPWLLGLAAAARKRFARSKERHDKRRGGKAR